MPTRDCLGFVPTVIGDPKDCIWTNKPPAWKNYSESWTVSKDVYPSVKASKGEWMTLSTWSITLSHLEAIRSQIAVYTTPRGRQHFL